MPDEKQWNCSRVADLFAELETLFKKYGLDVEGVGDALVDHIENCDACDHRSKEFGDRLRLFV